MNSNIQPYSSKYKKDTDVNYKKHFKKIHFKKSNNLDFPIRIIKMKNSETLIAKTEINEIELDGETSCVVVIRTPFIIERIYDDRPTNIFRNWIPYSKEETFILDWEDIQVISTPNQQAIEGYNKLILLDNMEYYGDEFNKSLVEYYKKKNINIPLPSESGPSINEDNYFEDLDD